MVGFCYGKKDYGSIYFGNVPLQEFVNNLLKELSGFVPKGDKIFMSLTCTGGGLSNDGKIEFNCIQIHPQEDKE